MRTIHFGSHGAAECGAHGDGRVDDECLTKDPTKVTCVTCRGWLPIVCWPVTAAPALGEGLLDAMGAALARLPVGKRLTGWERAQVVLALAEPVRIALGCLANRLHDKQNLTSDRAARAAYGYAIELVEQARPTEG